jgi:serine protease Do
MRIIKSYLLIFLFPFILFTSSCTGQEKKEQPGPLVRKENTSLEQLQKIARQNNNTRIEIPEKNFQSAMDFRYAAKKATPGVVHIKSVRAVDNRPQNRSQIPDPFGDLFGDDFWNQLRPEDIPVQSSGSGVIMTDDGYIVTNNHVIDEADDIEVVTSDNRSFKAKIIGRDLSTDIALLKVEGKQFPFIEIGSSDEVEIGEWVLAVGNPFNLSSTVTAGIVSAKSRTINVLKGQAPIESFIQTDAAVNPGNSGGALVNLDGQLIGINTAIATPNGVYAGYAFAVPVNIVVKIIDDLMNYGVVQRAYLGTYIRDMNSQLAEELGIDITKGVYVDSLVKNGSAEEAGVRPQDVIISVDGHEIETSPQLQELVARKRPGDKLDMTLLRKGKKRNISIRLKNIEGSMEAVAKKKETVLDNLGLSVSDLTDKEKKALGIKGGAKVDGIKEGKIKGSGMQEGFIITGVDREAVNSVEDLARAIEKKKGGGIMLEGIYPGVPGLYYYAFGLE